MTTANGSLRRNCKISTLFWRDKPRVRRANARRLANEQDPVVDSACVRRRRCPGSVRGHPEESGRELAYLLGKLQRLEGRARAPAHAAELRIARPEVDLPRP